MQSLLQTVRKIDSYAQKSRIGTAAPIFLPSQLKLCVGFSLTKPVANSSSNEAEASRNLVSKMPRLLAM
jgi:hypothetical protein